MYHLAMVHAATLTSSSAVHYWMSVLLPTATVMVADRTDARTRVSALSATNPAAAGQHSMQHTAVPSGTAVCYMH